MRADEPRPSDGAVKNGDCTKRRLPTFFVCHLLKRRAVDCPQFFASSEPTIHY